jgi:hypothetical protein
MAALKLNNRHVEAKAVLNGPPYYISASRELWFSAAYKQEKMLSYYKYQVKTMTHFMSKE